MLESIKAWIDENREYGLTLFYAYDPISGKPSITLFMAYVSFLLALGAGIYSLINPTSLLTTIAIFSYNIVLVILYMIRSINKAKFDLEKKSFEVEGNKTDVNS